MSQNNIDPYQPPTISTGGLSTTSEIETLRNIAFWQRFFSVLGYIVSGFTILAFAIQLLLAAATLPVAPAIIGGLVTSAVFAAMIVVVYVVPSILLGSAAQATRDLSEGRTTLSDYATKQKKFWRYVGIMVCIVMAINATLLVMLLFFGLVFSGVQQATP